MSSEIRKHHQFAEATLQNTTEVLQMPEIKGALGENMTAITTNIVDRFYHPNLRRSFTRLGGKALQASVPREYRDTDMLPIVASHAGQTVHLGYDAFQMLRPTDEMMHVYAKICNDWSELDDINADEFLAVFKSGRGISSRWKKQSFTVTDLRLAQTCPLRHTLQRVDTHNSKKIVESAFALSRPLTQLNMDKTNQNDTQSMRSHPCVLIHEAQHSHDILTTPLFKRVDERNWVVQTELKAYSTDLMVSTALEHSDYDGKNLDTEHSSILSYEIEEARKEANTDVNPYEASDKVIQKIVSLGLGCAIGIEESDFSDNSDNYSV